jgi:hypothetical protein
MNASLSLSAWGRRFRAAGWFCLLASLLVLNAGVVRADSMPAESTIAILAPPSGTRIEVPRRVVFEAVAVDPLGDIRHVEFFANGEFIGASDYLLRIATIPGRPIPHRLEWPVEKPGDYEVVARGKDTAGKEILSRPVVLRAVADDDDDDDDDDGDDDPTPTGWIGVKAGSVWRYSNDGTDLGTRWRETGFDDAAWASGAAPLGYGDGDETTVTRTGEPPHPVTAYFRHSFVVPADLNPTRLRVRLMRDDGAVVYLNGREILRSNMPRGDVEFGTLASDSTDDENEFRTFLVEASGLVAGDNVLAVEVHQAAASSSDLGFDLELATLAAEPLPVVSVTATREATGEPRPEARIAPGQFTLRRTGSTATALSVLLLHGGTAVAGKDYVEIPNSVTFPAGRSEVVIDVVALDDEEVEGDETVVVELVYPPVRVDPLAAAALIPPPTYRIDGEKSRAEVVIRDADSVDDATITVLEPAAGSVWPEGEVIPVRALAVDPKGAITRVEFYSGEDLLGESEVVFIQEPEPGTPIEHVFEWKGAKPGLHRLVVHGRDARGIPVRSAVVPVQVGDDAGGVVVLEIEAADPKAVEPVDGGVVDEGVFVIRRIAGPRDVAVPVFLGIDGDARNGVDYEALPERVDLPAGMDTVRLVVRPIGDKALEGQERVVVKLEPPVCPAIFPPPPQCYQVGRSGTAVVVIHDSSEVGNKRPTVRIVAPRAGTAFVEGEVIAIRAEAVDSDGTVVRLEILADGVVVSSATSGTASYDWSGAKPGLRRLSARAVDDDGLDGVSLTVPVMVRAVEDVAFVRRDLPPAYLPGMTLDVVLAAEPPRGSGAWIVEDVPPQGWVVSGISDEGVFDGTSGKVKFGPFTDGEVRRLSYRVTVPAGTTGELVFAGTSSLDGRTLPVGGDTRLRPAGEHHPADAKPVDNAVVADEVTAYAAAWKRGQAWGDDGGSIPVSYVARAGQIWKTGEAYRYDPAAGAPPACWVPGTTGGSGLALAGGPRRPAVVDVETGVAERFAEMIQRPGVGGRVEIHVQPPPGAQAIAVEESVPPGWRVSEISDDGVYDEAAGRIRWGLFFGDAVRRLTYVATPPAGVAGTSEWPGVVSFDGIEVSVSGVVRVGAVDEATVPRILGSRRAEKARVRFSVGAVADQVLMIEVSDDLVHWRDLGVVVNTGEEVEVTDDGAEHSAQRYYRLRPLAR